MIRPVYVAILMLAAGTFSTAQEPATPPPTGNTPLQQQKNAASATKDNSGTTGDQITHPPAAKGSTLIGCLAGPDKSGKFMLRNMNYRTGVEILGSPDDLKSDSGSKVKLTGQWQALAPAPASSTASSSTKMQSQSQSKATPAQPMKRFQVTDIEVIAQKCQPPSEVTPVSKEKRGKPTTYNAPSADNPQ